MSRESCPVLVLGGGLAGLTFSALYKGRSRVLEQAPEPGGLVRSRRIDVEGVGRFWFDHVLHLLHVSDAAVEGFAKDMVGHSLASRPPDAWVETPLGTCRYPLQLNLAAFPAPVVATCISDLVAAKRGASPETAPHLHEALLRTFGAGLCELFLHPYNRKMWGRSLTDMAPKIGWTTTRPDLQSVILGAQGKTTFKPYNHNGWYPSPSPQADLRCMGLLSASIARHVDDLRLRHRVMAVDLDTRTVHVDSPSGPESTGYTHMVSTLPLPLFASLTSNLPRSLKLAAASLQHNRVWSIAICLHGPRPNAGMWRYYSDESLAFTRLIYMHAFDTFAAPSACWGLLAEVVQPAEEAPLAAKELMRRVVADAAKVGAIGNDCLVLRVESWCCDPAYVVFTDTTEEIVQELQAYYGRHDVHLLGRYGRWEYLSMAQVMADALALANAVVTAD